MAKFVLKTSPFFVRLTSTFQLYNFMKHFISLIVLASLAVAPAYADTRSDKEMLDIACNAFAHPTSADNNIKRQAVRHVNIQKLMSSSEFNVYGSKSEGFVIVSRDDNFAPVLGYSSSEFEADKIPCGLKWWMNATDASLANMRAEGKTFQKTATRATEGDYLLQSTWGQTGAFADKTPGKCPSGCVATAMSQIMYYYKYPASASFEGSYKYSGTFEEYPVKSTYKWGKMINSYTGNYKVLQKNAVSALLRDAGYATAMQYSSNGSGTYDYLAARAFGHAFQYDSLSVNYYSRTFYSDDEWMAIIKSSIEAKTPVFYGGATDANEGHAFVLDGINADGMVHVNWGWDGEANGWFYIDHLGSAAYGEYNNSQDMICGMRATSASQQGAENKSQWGVMELSLSVNPDGTLHNSMFYLYNLSQRDFKGNTYLVLENTTTHKTYSSLITSEKDFGTIGCLKGVSLKEGDYLLEDLELPAGDYEMYFVSQSDNESKQVRFRKEGGEAVYPLTISADGKVSGSYPTTGIATVEMNGKLSGNSVDVYNLQGQKVLHTKSSGFNTDALKPGSVYIVRSGGQSKKIIK